MLNILFISSFLALAVGSIPLWLNAIARKRVTGSFLETRETNGTPFGFLDIVVMFFFWFVGQIGSVGLAVFLLDLDPRKLTEVADSKLAWMTILIAVGQLTATLMAIGVLLARYKSLSVFGWQPKNLRADLVIGGLAFALVVPSILLVQLLLTQFVDYEHSTLEMLARNADVLTVAASWFSTVLVAPFCEEVFFRGVLQAWLQRLGRGMFLSDQVLTGGWDSVETVKSDDGVELATPISDTNPYADPRTKTAPLTKSGTESSAISNSYWPIFVSAAIFGLAHAGQGPAPIPLFLFGLALGYLYRKTGSIVPCIVLHMLLNAFSMFWFTLQVLFSGEAPTVPNDVAQLVEGASICISGLF